jgi:hypothetical protein
VRRRLLSITAAGLLAVLTLQPGLSNGESAKASRTCSDYSNQREAQLRADTRDPDGDGIYCESLPCPCLKPGTTYRPPTTRKPVLFNGRCKRGKLPDYHCTPGSVFKNVTADEVCTSGYSKRVRNVSESLKRKVYLSYGIRRHRPYEYEIDHLVSLELGGSNSQKNLWPEKQLGAKSKDKIENFLHRELCDGVISLRSAQSKIKHWIRVRVSALAAH